MSPKTQKAGASSVTGMLRQDHKKVKGLFKEFEKAENAKVKERIVETALMELTVHAALEEELIYPAIRSEIDAEDLMDEAVEEHHVVHVLIAELKKMQPGDERYDAKFTVLGELCKHHIKEEEDEMLPKAEKSDIDWEELSAEVMKRKDQLMKQTASSSKNGKNRIAKKK
jgi:Hemerythrin HHE cation binding domain